MFCESLLAIPVVSYNDKCKAWSIIGSLHYIWYMHKCMCISTNVCMHGCSDDLVIKRTINLMNFNDSVTAILEIIKNLAYLYI